MAKRGRKSKYETLVKPNFGKIKKLVEDGATDKEIIDFIGITSSTFYEYMNKYPEFSELMRTDREKNIEMLKDTLFKKAVGFQYTEYEETKDPDGNVRARKITKTALPSETAILILLKHWDKNQDGKAKWANDPATLELKFEELKMKKEHFEKDDW